MTFNFKLPDIGEGVAEGEITRWLVKEGDLVKEDQPMVEVMTDKATVEITSPKSGRIQKILFPEGSVAPVHEVIVVIEESAGGGAAAAPAAPAAAAPARAPAPAATPPPAPPQPAPPPPRKEEPAPAPAARPPAKPAAQPQPAPRAEEHRTKQEAVEEVPTRPTPEQPHATTELTPFARASLPAPAAAAAATTATMDDGASDRVLATPATRRLARELGVDLAQVRGSGPRGRVLKADVQTAAAGGSRQPAAAPAAAPATRPATPAAPHEAPEVHPVERYQSPAAAPAPMGGEERIPYRGLRRAIGEQMVKSFFTAPHFTLVDEVDFTEIDAIRKLAKNDADASGAKLTYLPFVMKALCAAIRKFPTINASLDEEKGELVVKHDVHIGFALDTERGLMVPVVKNAAHRGLLSIASEITRLSDLGRAGKASREDLTGSTITISSAGSIGGAFATPIINHPEVSIIGLYQISDKPVVREGQIVIRKMGFVSITLDHRVVDGGTAARVLGEMKRLLGSPGLLLLGD